MRSKAAARSSALGSFQSNKLRDDRRHQGRPGAAVVIQPVPKLADSKSMRDHHRAATRQRRKQGHALGVYVIQRKNKKRPIRSRKLVRPSGIPSMSKNRPVSMDRSLRLPRGPGTVHQQSRIFGPTEGKVSAMDGASPTSRQPSRSAEMTSTGLRTWAITSLISASYWLPTNTTFASQ